ncbi:MAG: ribosome biogenesis GTP-binding protein YihA/YsxC [Peptococcaceae bacterium]|nr:ribosome biogenesis GTP-binding protein YihA/YsxC [Peptococcaceae bacterium]
MKIISAEFVTSAVKATDYPVGEIPEIALTGRSNVGKSSLLNKTVNRKGLARTSNTPGRTRLINFFRINDKFHLVDLPGYGYAKVSATERESWGRMIEGYLTGRGNLLGVCQLIDSRHPPTALDLEVHQWFKSKRIFVAVIATKTDKMSRSRMLRSIQTIKNDLKLLPEEKVLPFSAVTGQGRDELLEMLGRWLSL